MAFDAYGDTDWWALSLFMGMLVLAYALGGFSNFFLRRPFVSDAVLSVVAMSTVAFIVINFINKEGQAQDFGAGVDWRMWREGAFGFFVLLCFRRRRPRCSR